MSRQKNRSVFPGGAAFSWPAKCLTSKQLVWECGFHCATTTNYDLQCLLLASLALLKSKAFFWKQRWEKTPTYKNTFVGVAVKPCPRRLLFSNHCLEQGQKLSTGAVWWKWQSTRAEQLWQSQTSIFGWESNLSIGLCFSFYRKKMQKNQKKT